MWTQILVILLIWIIAGVAFGMHVGSAEPAEPEPGDGAHTPASLRPRPKLGAGAIALAEPDDEEDDLVSAVSHTPVYRG